MTIIIGLDPSKSTGYALYSDDKHFSAIECGVFKMPDNSDEYFTADQIGVKLANLIRSCKEQYGRKPDFAVVEGQMKATANTGRKQSFAGSIYPWIATSSLISTLAGFSIPYGTLMPSTWRKQFFGQGFKPQLDKTGKKDWKDAAIKECQRIGITLPSTKAMADDAAEACALAICWHSKEMTFHARRYQAPWMDLVQNRS